MTTGTLPCFPFWVSPDNFLSYGFCDSFHTDTSRGSHKFPNFDPGVSSSNTKIAGSKLGSRRICLAVVPLIRISNSLIHCTRTNTDFHDDNIRRFSIVFVLIKDDFIMKWRRGAVRLEKLVVAHRFLWNLKESLLRGSEGPRLDCALSQL
jgi:hypothetical protein